MNRISAIGSSARASAYYLGELNNFERLFLSEQEGALEWMGGGALALGLHSGSPVTERALKNALDGFSTDGRRRHVQRQRGKRRQPGWCFVFTPDKSVPAMWGVGDESERRVLERRHREAVAAAMAFVEAEAGRGRRGHQGKRVEPVGLLLCRVSHALSRTGDPLLHDHVIVANNAVRQDGTWGTINSRELYRIEHAAGAVYRAALAAGLVQDGLEFRPGPPGRTWSLEVVGVPRSLCVEFSSRRQQVEEVLARKGLSSSRAAQIATLESRGEKQQYSPEERRATWRAVGAKHGFGQEQVSQLFDRSQPVLSRAKAEALAEEAVRATLAKHGDDQHPWKVHFDAVQHSAHLGVHPNLVLRALAASRERQEKGQAAQLAQEAQEKKHEVASGSTSTMLEAAKREASDMRFVISNRGLRRVPAASSITGQMSLVTCLDASPHDEPEKALREVARVYRRAGYQVLGVAPNKACAAKLSAQLGMPFDSVQGFNERTGFGLVAHTKHAARQIARAAVGKPTFAPSPLQLTRRTVVIVGFSERLGAEKLGGLLERTTSAGAKAVVSGDSRADVLYENDGAFRLLSSTHPAAIEVERSVKTPTWRLIAEDLLARRDGRQAISVFAANGAVHVEASAEKAHESLFEEWTKARRADRSGVVLVAPDRKTADAFNVMAQRSRRFSGDLGFRSVKRRDGMRFSTGDIVRFRHGNGHHSVAAGALGTIVGIGNRRAFGPFDRRVITVLMHDRKPDLLGIPRRHRVKLSMKGLEAMDLGYCVELQRVHETRYRRALIALDVDMHKSPELYTAVASIENISFHTHTECLGHEMSEVSVARKEKRERFHHRRRGKEQEMAR